ncbi:aldehyde dehydrogenase [Niallia nealsonii]|uniref:Aldehyde dehydrogenase n=1 Tax=Niallia nealsonii TaxID=115979 RepID=A0A2N0Z209_9BACI|nr:aldehyde dehydrogenase [Niallia nealsonii]PKG23545.1 aldehyde dehydrogenase [Niallia nealsonii]
MQNKLTNADVEQLVKEHQQFFYTKATRSLDFRLQQLLKLKGKIKEYEEQIIAALQKDLGKHPFESYTTEIGFVLSSITYTMKHLKKWTKQKKVKTPFTLFPAKSYIRYEPLGTILIIGPFNYPFQLVVEPLIGAIAAGNGAVIKPSEMTPSVSAVITKIIQATFDSAYIRSIEGGVSATAALLEGKFDYIFFTGSERVGKIVMEAAAKNLTPITLELGGKSPAIVDETADIAIAAQRIIWGKTVNAGQTCVAPDYVVVHETVKDQLIQEMKLTLHSFYGDSLKTKEDFGRIVNDKHFLRLQNILQREQENKTIIHGGITHENSRFIGPTLIHGKWDSPSMEEEIFGPILPIITYTDIHKVPASINEFSKPLALYLFTADAKVEETILDEISSGGVSINDTITHLANPELPFGGVGHSGMGAYHGKYSFFTFSHQRSVLKKSNRINTTILQPPYTEKKLNIIRKLLK